MPAEYNIWRFSSEEEPEQTGRRLTMAWVTEKAVEVALRDGGHFPALIIEGRKSVTFGNLIELPDTHEERMHMMFVAGQVMGTSRQVGTLRQVFFICEAWMSSPAAEGDDLILPS